MENIERLTLAEMQEFVANNRHFHCAAVEKEAAYGSSREVLQAQRYRRLSKGQKGTVRRFLAKLSGCRRAQRTRRTQRWRQTRRIERKPARRPRFPRRYTAADIALLAEVDAAPEDLSGAATRHLLRREWEVYADERFQPLAGISAWPLYNLRHSTDYGKIRVRVQPTKRARWRWGSGVSQTRQGSPAICG